MMYTSFVLCFSILFTAIKGLNYQNHQIPMADAAFNSANAQKGLQSTSALISSAEDNLNLSDILDSTPTINSFAGIMRKFPSINQRLESRAMNTICLAPTNHAIISLPLKPWENSQDLSALGEQAYHGKLGKARADQNIQNFVEAHIIPIRPWLKGEKTKTLSGDEYSWDVVNGVKIIQPGNIRVIDDSKAVHNGELWIIDKALR